MPSLLDMELTLKTAPVFSRVNFEQIIVQRKKKLTSLNVQLVHSLIAFPLQMKRVLWVICLWLKKIRTQKTIKYLRDSFQ